MDDMQLLREFASTRCQRVFAELVSRHIDWVSAVCRRRVRDAALADDVTQAVFIVLAKKADSLPAGTVLAGWLCSTIRYATADALKSRARRQKHERRAAEMLSKTTGTQTEPDDWQELLPLVDAAMAKLSPLDRDALALRFYGRHTVAEVATTLGLSEEAAKKRVARGLEKLRRMLRSHVGTLSVAGLANLLAADVEAAPPGLLTEVVAVATTGKAGAALAIADGALKLLALAKMKIATAVLLAVLGGTGTTLIVHEMSTTQPTAVSAAIADASAVAELTTAAASQASSPAEGDALHLQGLPEQFVNLDSKLLRFTHQGGAFDQFHLRIFVQALPELPNCLTEVFIERDADSVAMVLRSVRNGLPYAYVTDRLLIRVDPQNPGGVVVTEGVAPDAILRAGNTPTGARTEVRVAATPQKRVDVDLASLIADLQRGARRHYEPSGKIFRLNNPYAGGRIVLADHALGDGAQASVPPVAAYGVTEYVRLALQVREIRVDPQSLSLPRLTLDMLGTLDIPVRRLSGIATGNLLPEEGVFENRLHREAAVKLDSLIRQSDSGKSLNGTRRQVAIAEPRSQP